MRAAWLLSICGIMSVVLAEEPAAVAGRERIRVVQQDISKWDKLTGAERAEFLKDKGKQVAEAEAAARAAKAKAKPPKISPAHHPVLSAEDSQKAAPRGIPKSIEDAGR